MTSSTTHTFLPHPVQENTENNNTIMTTYRADTNYTLSFVLSHPNAKLPQAYRKGDAAFDISCVEDVILQPHKVTKVSTGLVVAHMPDEETRHDYFLTQAAEPNSDPYNPYSHSEEDNTPIPSSVFLKVEGRGGLASKGIFPVGGIIDSNYRGEIIVLLCNVNDEPYSLKAGDRCAQLVIYKVMAESFSNEVHFQQVEKVETVTERNAQGFGSSGN